MLRRKGPILEAALLICISCANLWAEARFLDGELEDEISSRSRALVFAEKYSQALALWDGVLRDYPSHFYAVRLALRTKASILLAQGKIDEAVACIQSLRDRWTEPKVGDEPSTYLVTAVIHGDLAALFQAAKMYPEALKERDSFLRAQRDLINATPLSPEERAIRLLQLGPTNLAFIYKDWGRLDLAREKIQEELDFLNSPAAERDLLSKLEKEEYRLGWEFTRVVWMPLEIAELLVQEGKPREALEILRQLKGKMEDKEFARRHGQQSYQPGRMHFTIAKKKIDDLLLKADPLPYKSETEYHKSRSGTPGLSTTPMDTDTTAACGCGCGGSSATLPSADVKRRSEVRIAPALTAGVPAATRAVKPQAIAAATVATAADCCGPAGCGSPATAPLPMAVTAAIAPAVPRPATLQELKRVALEASRDARRQSQARVAAAAMAATTRAATAGASGESGCGCGASTTPNNTASRTATAAAGCGCGTTSGTAAVSCCSPSDAGTSGPLKAEGKAASVQPSQAK